MNRLKTRCLEYHCFAFVVVLVAAFAMLQSRSDALAQGFNWQYSAREPTNYPTLFVGATGVVSLTQHFATLTSTEVRGDGSTCLCGVYQRGTGQIWGGGLYAEQWLERGDIALTAGLRYEMHSSRLSFQKNNGPWIGAPGRTSQDLITAWTLHSDVRSLLVDAGAKYKFYPLQLFAAASLHAGYVLTQVASQQEVKISPAEHPFQPITTEGDFPALNRFMLGGKVAVGWDVPLLRGVYASPALFVAAPITNSVQSAAGNPNVWRWLQYGVQVSIVYGWLPPREER